MAFDPLVAQFLQSQRARRRSPRTIEWYAEQFAIYAAWAAGNGAGPGLPSAFEIESFLADQHARGLAPATVKARFVALRALWRWACKRALADPAQNPMGQLDAPTVPRVRRAHVSPAQFDQLIAAIPRITWIDHRDALILNLLWFSGLRLSELVALAPADLDTTRKEVLIRSGKGGKARIVPTAPAVVASFVAYRYLAPAPLGDRLLLRSDGYAGAGGPLANEGVRQMLIRRCKAAGLAPLSAHKFRHGFAMWLLNAGARMETVSAAMGHSDPAVTSQIYAYTLTETVRAEYDQALAMQEGKAKG